MCRRVTVVCVTVYVFICHATLYQTTWYIYTLKVRYHRILHELLKSFDSWISLKRLCSRDMALFAYHNDLQHRFLLTEDPPMVLHGQD